MSGTNWLDLSLSSNRHIRTYVQGFVDISGGNLIVRNNNLFVYGGDSSLNGRLLVSGDSSLNGNVVIGSTLYPTGGINLQNNLNMGGLINQSGTTVQGGVIYQPIVTSDVSAIINASNMYSNNMVQSGSKFIIGNANNSVVIGVNGNPLTVSGPLFALYDASLSGRLFVTKDVSLNGNLFVNADVSLNSRLYVGSDVSFNSRLFVGGDASLNSRLYVGGDVSLNSRVFINGDASLNSRLYVGGDASLNSRLYVGGDVSLNSRLVVGGDASFNSRVFINSDLSMNGNLTVGKDLLVNGNLSVKQYSTNLTVYTVAYNNFTVAEDMSLNGRLYLTGDASMNTRLLVGGDVSFNGKGFIAGNLGIGKVPLYALDVSGAVQTSTGSSSVNYNNFYGKVPPTNAYLSSFSPNSVNATSNTWVNNNVTWSVSASSTFSTLYSYLAFNTTNTAGTSQWGSATTYLSTGLYNGSVSTAIFGQSAQLGEWLQIQSSVPAVMNTYTFSAGGIYNMPKTYWIVGSNDGSTWYPLQSAAFVANPFTQSSTLSSVFNVNTSGSQTAGATTVTTTIYGSYTTGSYTYFRLICSTLWSGSTTTTEISEWTPTFSVATQTGPSRAVLYMDASNINQLDVSGSLALVNSNPSSITVTPNTTSAALSGWQNNNITWFSIGTNPITLTENGWGAFSNSYLTSGTSPNYPYMSVANTYNATTGVYTNTTYTTSTTVDGTAIAGEYVQLNSSVPLVMKTYNLTSRYYNVAPYNYAYALPRQYKIVGSNDGVTWTSIQDAQFSAAPITTAATSTTYSQSTAYYNIVTTTSAITQQSNNSITGYANALNSYTYFRIIVRAMMGTQLTCTNPANDTRTNFYWNVNFTPATSAVSLSLDNAVTNQLNVGGGLSVASKVGIGMTPNYALDVLSTSYNVMSLRGTVDHQIQYYLNSGSTFTGQDGGTAGGASYRYFQNNTEDKIRFYQGAGGALALQPVAGNVGIGVTNPQVALSVGGYVWASGICTLGYNSISYFGGNYTQNMNSPAIHVNSPDTLIRYPITFGTGGMANGTSTFTNGTIYGSITTNGSATQFNTSSDYRLKENVVDLSNGLYVVTKLKPRQFNFIECPDAIQSGFIAHEVQEFVPNAVIHNKDEVDASGNIVTQQLDASKLIPFLVGAIKDQNQIIQDLESKLASLEARLAVAGF